MTLSGARAPTALHRSIAYRLQGVQLDGGWTVGDRITSCEDHPSGGLSSVQYVVSRGLEQAFLKVLDPAIIPREGESRLDARARATRAFAFEVSLLKACVGKDRIVRYKADGEYSPIPGEPDFTIPYVIVELADSDVRDFLRANRVDVAWCLHAAHDLAVGLKQMHSAGIFHQDMKASNALFFKGIGCKIGDVGSACSGLSDINRLENDFVGSWLYAPPEIWYGVSVDDSVRCAGDLFMLGNLIVYMLVGVSVRGLLMEQHLAEIHRPHGNGRGRWRGTYEAAFPYLQHAFSATLVDIEAQLPIEVEMYDYRSELMQIIRSLCNPDFRKRGFIDRDGAITYNLERAVTSLSRLAKNVSSGRPRSY